MTAHSHATPVATRPVLQSLYQQVPLNSATFYREYNEKTAEEEAAEKEAADKAAADKEAADKEAADKKAADEKKGTAEERVTNALKERDEAKAALAKKEDEDKTAKEAKLKEDGKKDELLLMKETEVKTQKDEIQKLTDELEDKGGQLTAAETDAKTEVQAAVDGIKDEKKKAIVENALEGKTVFQQRKSLAGLLELAGVKTGRKVGSGLPGEGAEGTTKMEDDEADYRKLHEKQTKALSGGDPLSPTEKKQYRELGTKLRKGREEEAKKKADAEEELTVY